MYQEQDRQLSSLEKKIVNLVKKERGKPIPIGIVLRKLQNEDSLLPKKDIFKSIDFLLKEFYLKKSFKGYLLIDYIDAPKDMSTIKTGTLFLNSHGSGVVRETLADNSICSYFVHQKHLNGAMDRDQIEFVKLIKEPRNGLHDAAILNIYERNKTYFVAEIIRNEEQELVAVTDNKKIYQEIIVDDIETLVEGYKILVQAYEINEKTIKTTIKKIIGHVNDVGVDIMSVVDDNGILYETPEEVKNYANSLSFNVTDKDLKLRRDITDRKILSIDPSTSKDLDDAVYVKKQKDGTFFLSVNIADVSHYVKVDNPINEDAFNKGTSVYLVDRVIPMLPHKLSNDLCSLNENKKRFAITCDLIIDSNGNYKSIDLYPSIMMNHKRLSYDEVNEYLKDNNSLNIENEYKEILNDSLELHNILRKKKNDKGYVEFKIQEPEIVLDEKNFPIDIRIKKSGTAQKIVEDFMVAANEAVTIKSSELNMPFIYRTHTQPEEKKIKNFLIETSKLLFKIVFDKNEEVTSKQISKWINDNKNHNNFKLLNKLLLRSMQKANYSTDNLGHFGLALENYTHFTSPIRRYSDLIVHRLFWMYLFDKQSYTDEQRNKLSNELSDICDQCNKTEIAAVKTERDVNSMKYAEYMTKHINETFEGQVSTVTSFGMFIELENTIEGLVLIRSLKDDFYQYDEENLILIGKKTNKKYSLGTKVKVKVINANKLERKIDLEIVD